MLHAWYSPDTLDEVSNESQPFCAVEHDDVGQNKFGLECPGRMESVVFVEEY
jgi:hypothetical protein